MGLPRWLSEEEGFMIIERRGVVVVVLVLDGANAAATDDEATATDENTTSVVVAAERLRVIVDLTSLPGQTRCSKLSCLNFVGLLVGKEVCYETMLCSVLFGKF